MKNKSSEERNNVSRANANVHLHQNYSRANANATDNVFSNKIENTNPIPEKIFEDSELEHMFRTHKKRQIEQKQWQIKMKNLYRI